VSMQVNKKYSFRQNEGECMLEISPESVTLINLT